ncbi:MBL fold metallo-hydrolase [Sinobaca sp. H24]|uniref:MBL fold metallo-hydrolase n=1 Tax=Sinobaca sp. H24 TaxID=2923376 RepID=UPI00207979BC|nr:MBL fold metallo-hydrolase [Sinobaca sp. H24]
MDWKQIPLGPLQTNCYVLFNENKEAVIFDPGGHGDILNTWLIENDLRPQAVLLTHAHFDHIGAVEDVRQKWNIPVYLHETENDWLTDPEKNGSSRFLGGATIKAEPADVFITKESELQAGSFHFSLFHTPGHSPGSVSFYHKETETVFSGDVLFENGIGRTDLPGGDYETLIKSINDFLMPLPEDTAVACGHGNVTTIGNEMTSNPFLHGFS